MAKRLNKNMVVVLTAFGFLLMTVAGVLMVLQLRQDDPLRFRELAEERAVSEEFTSGPEREYELDPGLEPEPARA